MLASSNTPKSSQSLVRVCSIASGGMGQVELALRHEGRFRRLYAVKRLHPLHREDADFRAMFLDEARVAGLIRHPNVVGVLDVGEDEEGPYLVMDYVEGIALTLLVKDQTSGVLPVQVCARIVQQAAEGLHAAHELRSPDGEQVGVVHRDVSPQNILLGFDGTARVTDFGIAKALDRVTRTSTGILKGKMGYMAPEQLQFEEPDRRSDLFALGVVFHEMLSGARLYANREGADGARRILHEPPPDIGDERDDVPPAIVQLLFELLAKQRDQRPASAKIVSQRLTDAIAELVLSEGPIDMAAFLEERFREERAQREQEVAAALRSLESLPPLRVASVAPVSSNEAPTTARPPRRRIGAVVATAVAALALIGTGALAYAVLAPAPPAPSSGPPPIQMVTVPAPQPAATPREAPPIAAPEPGPPPRRARITRRAPEHADPEPTPVEAPRRDRPQVQIWDWQ